MSHDCQGPVTYISRNSELLKLRAHRPLLADIYTASPITTQLQLSANSSEDFEEGPYFQMKSGLALFDFGRFVRLRRIVRVCMEKRAFPPLLYLPSIRIFSEYAKPRDVPTTAILMSAILPTSQRPRSKNQYLPRAGTTCL